MYKMNGSIFINKIWIGILQYKRNIVHAFLFGALMFQFQKLHNNFMKSYNEIYFPKLEPSITDTNEYNKSDKY